MKKSTKVLCPICGKPMKIYSIADDVLACKKGHKFTSSALAKV